MTLFLFTLEGAASDSLKVLTGLDRVKNFYKLFKNKRIGIITNHTAYNSKDEHIVDVFFNMPGVKVTALFGPEHGIRGREVAGGKIDNSYDPANNIPIFSLYGKTRKPTVKMIENCDVLIFDIQDVGARFYTYISTMALAMEAAAENNKSFIVLDRPNPINGMDVEGNTLEPKFKTFVGMFPLPVRHGMTVGELALMINTEGWLKNGIKVNLKVISMLNWERSMWYDETKLRWRPPSPNIPDLEVASVYPGTCLFEGTNISEGRGTYKPFLKIGASWFKKEDFIDINDNLNIPGVELKPVSFTPKSIESMSINPKFKNIEISGLQLLLTDRKILNSYLSGIRLVKYFYEKNKEKFVWRERHFDRLCGTDKIRKFIQSGVPMHEIEKWVNKDIEFFLEKRSKYLLYQ